MPGREEGSAVPRASTASGDCSAGLAKAAVFPLLQLTFEKDPEGYSFTLTLGLQGLEAKSGKDASTAPVTQEFPWQNVASTIIEQTTKYNGNSQVLWRARSCLCVLLN